MPGAGEAEAVRGKGTRSPGRRGDPTAPRGIRAGTRVTPPGFVRACRTSARSQFAGACARGQPAPAGRVRRRLRPQSVRRRPLPPHGIATPPLEQRHRPADDRDRGEAADRERGEPPGLSTCRGLGSRRGSCGLIGAADDDGAGHPAMERAAEGVHARPVEGDGHGSRPARSPSLDHPMPGWRRSAGGRRRRRSRTSRSRLDPPRDWSAGRRTAPSPRRTRPPSSKAGWSSRGSRDLRPGPPGRREEPETRRGTWPRRRARR